MGDLINNIILKAKKKPIAAVSWSLFTISIAFLLKYQISYVENSENKEKLKNDLRSANAEFHIADRIAALWLRFMYSFDSLSKPLELIANKSAEEITYKDLLKADRLNSDVRDSLNKIIVLSANAKFSNKTYSDLIHDIESDAVMMDNTIKEQREFLRLIFTNIDSANKIKSKFENTPENLRRHMQAAARIPQIEAIIDRCQEEYNSQVKIFNQRSDLYSKMSLLSYFAWIYIIVFIIYWVITIAGQTKGKAGA